MTLPSSLLHFLCRACAVAPGDLQVSPVSGGSINTALRLHTRTGPSFFVKHNSARIFPHLFEREAEGLRHLAATGTLRTPEVIATGVVEDHQVLVLEWIEPGPRTGTFWTRFGEGLAALHHVSREHFGFDGDNHMGSVPQDNRPSESWTLFFRTQRLEPLLQRCRKKERVPPQWEAAFLRLYEALPKLFPEEPPALLHGDLWSGNFLCAAGGLPVLIDPAVYYGHRAIDLGMTKLFGGFPPSFYEAYHYHHPRTEATGAQEEICNLYPLLIHLYLFGPAYRSAIERILQRYVPGHGV
ncbi:MAG TPA: fructosamine kinase family protein [Chitinophagaceae bacterium]|jgi:fructosamine-3-kinase|nr:fructosamine kinase family protein [Chitinophagaceae bacterium]